MNKVLIGLIIALSVSLVTAASLEGYDYFVTDKVSGRNLELVEFDDELGIVDTLMYNDMLKRSTNNFKGEFAMGIPDDNGEPTFIAEDVVFYGKSTFDGGSYVQFSLENFEVDETNMDEYGMTEVFGTALLILEERVIVEKEIPVEVNFLFYEDYEEKEFFEQYIYLESLSDERLHITFENEEDKRNNFKQNRDCYGDCFPEGPYDWTIVYTNENGTVPLSEQD